MRKFTGFRKEHLGCDVTDIIRGNGVIESFGQEPYPIAVRFKDLNYEEYTNTGKAEQSESRSLYFGHSINISVTGEEVPEPKLICPVCGVEHEIIANKFNDWEFSGTSPKCPLLQTIFDYRNHAELAMKNLINAMENKK